MKVYAKLNDARYNAEFESSVSCDKKDYGNGCYMTITRNGEDWKYVDCRYMKGFSEEKALKSYLKNYFGKNLLELKNVKDLKTQGRK